MFSAFITFALLLVSTVKAVGLPLGRNRWGSVEQRALAVSKWPVISTSFWGLPWLPFGRLHPLGLIRGKVLVPAASGGDASGSSLLLLRQPRAQHHCQPKEQPRSQRSSHFPSDGHGSRPRSAQSTMAGRTRVRLGGGTARGVRFNGAPGVGLSFNRPHLSCLNRITATFNFRSSDWLTFDSWRRFGAEMVCFCYW